MSESRSKDRVLETYWAGWWAAHSNIYKDDLHLLQAIFETTKRAFEAGYRCAQAEKAIGGKKP